MSVKFQLIFNSDPDQSMDLIELMPEIARILDIDTQFVGAFFKRSQTVILESSEFKEILLKQKALEKIGIYCDIKPLKHQSTAKKETSTEKLLPKKDSLYKSVFKTPDDTRVATITFTQKKDQHDLGVINMDNKDILYKPQGRGTLENPGHIDPADPKADDNEFNKWKG